MRLMAAILVGVACLGISCDSRPEQRAQQKQEPDAVQWFAEVARVKVDREGAIYLDGKRVSIELLREEFSRLKRANGAVWYYREDPHGEPPAQAMAVMQAIIDAGLPVKLVQKDFD